MDLLQIADTIRQLRRRRQWTVEQLAQRAGFSKGFISQVENFRISPSLKALARLADALEVPVAELFGPVAGEPDYTVGNLESGVEIRRDNDPQHGLSYLALACPQFGRKLEPFLIEYRPAAEPRGFKSHDTEEFFLLIEGEVEFFIRDDATRFPLASGGTVYLKADLPHRVELAAGCARARALVIYAPHEKRKRISRKSPS